MTSYNFNDFPFLNEGMYYDSLVYRPEDWRRHEKILEAVASSKHLRNITTYNRARFNCIWEAIAGDNGYSLLHLKEVMKGFIASYRHAANVAKTGYYLQRKLEFLNDSIFPQHAHVIFEYRRLRDKRAGEDIEDDGESEPTKSPRESPPRKVIKIEMTDANILKVDTSSISLTSTTTNMPSCRENKNCQGQDCFVDDVKKEKSLNYEKIFEKP